MTATPQVDNISCVQQFAEKVFIAEVSTMMLVSWIEAVANKIIVSDTKRSKFAFTCPHRTGYHAGQNDVDSLEYLRTSGCIYSDRII